MAGSLEEAGAGWGQVGDEGGKEGAGWPISAPFILAAPYLPGPQQRSLDRPGHEQGVCQC